MNASSPRRLLPGRPWPLGASIDAGGVNFALFSSVAERVYLCVLDAAGRGEYELPECTDQIWHGRLPGATAGLRYAFRVVGPNAPERGLRCDPSRLLLDPCARELVGEFSWSQEDARDSAYGLSCRVIDPAFDWGDDRPPAIPLQDSLLYEIHVRGATLRQPEIPAALRGSYAGLAHPAMLAHYRKLGVTALNLLPVQHFLDERRLAALGLVNYWGYNPIAWFAPEPRYASRVGARSPIAEFRGMVRTLHAAGIEVILDVVFNHSAETDENGPTLSLRGIDNAAYYRLSPVDPAHYENHSGCGNVLRLAHPRTLQLVMDALRWWVGEMHVDGFRFDLAAALTRGSAFLAGVAQDPLLGRVKLIAEPWDIGPDGYRLGRFPTGWSEWNDRFRDGVRAFWLTGGVGIDRLAQLLAGSREVFDHDGRAAQAGINYVAAHDGFTLRDLVSFARRHNEANGEANRDGHADEHSANCGVEGDSDDPAVLATRRALQRALLATLFVAQGLPMLQAGDELGRSQGGNNNAYCQDNATTWTDWPAADHELADFVAGLAALRRELPQLRARRWLSGAITASGDPDVSWWHAEGRPMQVADWQLPGAGSLGFVLAAAGAAPRVLCLINRDPQDCVYRLPPGDWQLRCDSAAASAFAVAPVTGQVTVAARSLQLLIEKTRP